MADAEKQRRTHSIKLERLRNAVNNLDEDTVTQEQVTHAKTRSKEVMNAAEEAHNRVIDATTTDAAFQTQEQAFEVIEDIYGELCVQLLTLQSSIDRRIATTRTTTTTTSSLPIKLPEIKLPVFDGKYEDWPSFEDLFVATIDKHASLSLCQKFQYLKSCTKGDAANLIKSFSATDKNYTEAWKLLKERYNNNREIVHSITKRLISQPQLKGDSTGALETMLNTTMECIRSLQAMGRPVDKWDDIIVCIIQEKLDADTKSEWAKQLTGVDPPTFKQMQTFLEQRLRTLHARGKPSSRSQQRPHVNVHHSSSTSSSCRVCQGFHQIYQCSTFREMTPQQRNDKIRSLMVCINCFKPHYLKDCTSTHTCKVCNRYHHTLLHIDKASIPSHSSQRTHQTQRNESSSTAQGNAPSTVNSFSCSSANQSILLKTALVNVRDITNRQQQCRILLDECSEASFITNACARKLGLRKQRTNVGISGIAAQGCTANWETKVRLHSIYNEYFYDIDALILPQITSSNIPRAPCPQQTLAHLQGIQLADPHYGNPGQIDILIGADVVPYIRKDGTRKGTDHEPVAEETIFGWVIYGKANESKEAFVHSFISTCNLGDILRKFWEREEVPSSTQALTLDEQQCESHFMSTHSRTAEGRYVVRLPFKENIKQKLGSTKEQAFFRLYALERRFKKYPQHHHEYIKFMREYESMGHMKPVSYSSPHSTYLPHHFVIKADSTTTKLRVVFDGSAKSSTGISLNDALSVGATVQQDLFTLLLRFRFHTIALKADIAKMYRQFIVHPDDQDYQRILWRENANDPIKEYCLSTITYGTSCAPFLATRCLNQLAEDEKKNHSIASPVLANDMYVDDLISGSDCPSQAITLIKDLNAITQKAGLELRKWCSNDASVLASIPEELREDSSLHNFDNNSSIKALGVQWQPNSDSFTFSVQPTSTKVLTKRHLLSEISKTFDPVGWLTPVTITAKLLMQELWINGVDWNEEATAEVCHKWKAYQDEMTFIASVKIPRCVISPKALSYQVHAFSDASEKAHAAAIYLRVTRSDESIIVNLLTSKSHVAPVKQVSLPKLELCGANLLAELVEAVVRTFNFKYTLQCWTDSTITLRWISNHSRRWKTYVANRVSFIQSITPPESWRHVKGEDNPADLPSRGIPASQLANSSLWWHGPSWLSEETFPVSFDHCDMEEVAKEAKSLQVLSFHASSINVHDQLFNSTSSLFTLLRRTAYFIRFINFLKTKTIIKTPFPFISTAEIANAKQKLIVWSQCHSFHEDRFQLKKEMKVLPSSKLNQLLPFIDVNNVIRVGGRIQKSNAAHDVMHPVILCHSHPLTKLIIIDIHKKNLHSGFSLTLATLRRNYYVIRGRDEVRNLIRKCVPCRRQRPLITEQLMGNLPEGRVTPTRPFTHTGVDYAGPFNVRMKTGRKVPTEKCYFAIFVCFATKAIHLEAVTNLTSEAFIAAYERFISRRGICAHLYSDRGTNFIGAEKLLKQMQAQAVISFQQQFVQRGTQFHFNCSAAPEKGGIWEAGVKSVKFHFSRVVGPTPLTFEQFTTLLCRIEACLNSRPICALSSDPNDVDALTPGHFLIGGPLTSIPEPDVTTVKQNRLSYWQSVRQMTQHFWTRWSNEYLTSLQQRFKWTQKRPNVQQGDIVVIRDEQLPVTKWRLGRILEAISDDQGLVRIVKLKTASGEINRPITKISPLVPINESE